jgi:ABC-type uncharacterized transport system substrate-binding protein
VGLDAGGAGVTGVAGWGVAFSTLQAGQAQGVVILRGAFMGAHVKTLVDLALKHRLPTISDMALLAAQGGLMSYGYNFDDAVREAAGIVDKILRGANVSGKEGREGKCHDGARSYAL